MLYNVLKINFSLKLFRLLVYTSKHIGNEYNLQHTNMTCKTKMSKFFKVDFNIALKKAV